MKKLNMSIFPFILAASTWLAGAVTAQAAEVDFSCMSYKVWPKSHVSSQYMSYDIVIQNSCPGAVYWAMCIERLDPNTSKVIETHNPTGFVEVDKKARVNLNLYKKAGNDVFRNRFQEFYVDIGYSIDSLPVSHCYAKPCEAKKSTLRKAIKTNEAAWEQAEKKLNAKIAADCPDTGWDKVNPSECASKVRESSKDDFKAFAEKDRELRNQMAEIDPEICKVYSGGLVPQ